MCPAINAIHDPVPKVKPMRGEIFKIEITFDCDRASKVETICIHAMDRITAMRRAITRFAVYNRELRNRITGAQII